MGFNSAEASSPQAAVDFLLEQEKRLQFTSFTSDDALKLGLTILQIVKTKYNNKPVAIDITVNGLLLFRYAMDGTSHDNEMWIRRKSNSVNRFRHSSYWLGNALLVKGKTLEQAYFVPESDYASHGGSFPLIVMNVGMVGTITVTGLKQHEDHGVIVESIEQFLSEA